VPTQPLSDVRVLELADGIAGSYAAKLFADYGADVIKVEPPGGDRVRLAGPFPDGAPDPEQGALHLHLDTNKRSVVADLSDPDGQALVRHLLPSVDVVIDAHPPGALQGWGLGFAALRALQPTITLVQISPFGQDGPYAGYLGEEIVYYAMGGPMCSTGVEEREPVKLAGDVVQYQCGNMAATAAMAAMLTARANGRAVSVDISNLETQEGSIDRRLAFLLGAAYNGRLVRREGTQRLSPAPTGIYPVADGYVQIITIPAWVPRMLATLEDPGLAEHFSTDAWLVDPETPARCDEVLYPWLLTRTRQEAMEAAEANKWPVTALNLPVELLDDPHFTERAFLVEVDHPATGPVRQPGPPFRMDDGWKIRRPAPLLDQHGDEVRAEEVQARPAPAATDGQRLPLEGIRVLDLTVVWAGPYVTMLLADLGAEVIRVDNPWLFPSSTKGFAPRLSKELADALGALAGAFPEGDPGEDPWNRHAMFNCHARNKRIVTLDLGKPLGVETFLQLAEISDVVVENNAAGVVDKLGIGWDALHARNPRLSMLRMPPMGLNGAYHDYVGFGAHFEALSGLTALRGYHDADPTSTTSVFHMDPASGAAGAFAVMNALKRRDETGTGSLIELAQSENVMQHIGEYFVDASRTGRTHQPLGNRHRSRAPQGCYPCAGRDRWAVISVGDDDQWRGLQAAMGRPAWADDPRFGTPQGRHDAHDEIDAGIAGWTSQLDPDEVFHRCQAHGVPAGPVMNELDALADPHLRARGFFRPNVSPSIDKEYDHPAHLWHWDGPDMRWGPIGAMGHDNDYVYRELLGLDEDRYRALEEDGHISLAYLDADGNPI